MDAYINLSDIYTLLPLFILIAWALLLLLVDLFIPKGHKGWTALLAAAGLLVTMAASILRPGLPPLNENPILAFNLMAISDGFSLFLDVLFLGAALAGIALAYDYLQRMDIERGEYYVLLLFTTSGMMLMAHATDLIVVFLALELLSIPLYVLSGFARPRVESEEAALKYFLLGSFASAFVLFGIAMLYGATEHTDLSGIVEAVKGGLANPTLSILGAGLLVIGFGFKVAAVPFHMWTPDVYQGAPSPVSAFMSVGAKAAGFAALLRVFLSAFSSLNGELYQVLWLIAALTMVVGNVVAISQTNIKRMLAYSSIAHAGYILMAFVPAPAYGSPQPLENTVGAALFYLMAYAITSLGAWAVVIALEKAEGAGLALDDYAGLGRNHTWLAVAMAVFMFSFTGLPPTLGFMGKFYLFRNALASGYTGLAIIGILTSLLSAYYYLRVVVIMFMKEGQPEVRNCALVMAVAGMAAIATIVMSLAPDTFFALATQAVLSIL